MNTGRTVYSQKLKAALDKLRPAVKGVGLDLQRLTQKRVEMAPIFLKTFRLWSSETKRPFIAFVQALDSSVPASRNAYKKHPSYRAAEYLKELAHNPDARSPKKIGLTLLAMLAITIKSFLPLCGSQRDQKAALAVLIATTKWRDSERRRLVATIRRARPVGLPNVPRLVEAAKQTKAVVVAFERERLAS